MVRVSDLRAMVVCSGDHLQLVYYILYVFWRMLGFNPRFVLIISDANCRFMVRLSDMRSTVNGTDRYKQ